MTYSYYKTQNGTHVVTLINALGIERELADKHLFFNSTQESAIDGRRRDIYTDNGDYEQFLLFELEVEEAYNGLGVA